MLRHPFESKCQPNIILFGTAWFFKFKRKIPRWAAQTEATQGTLGRPSKNICFVFFQSANGSTRKETIYYFFIKSETSIGKLRKNNSKKPVRELVNLTVFIPRWLNWASSTIIKSSSQCGLPTEGPTLSILATKID